MAIVIGGGGENYCMVPFPFQSLEKASLELDPHNIVCLLGGGKKKW